MSNRRTAKPTKTVTKATTTRSLGSRLRRGPFAAPMTPRRRLLVGGAAIVAVGAVAAGITVSTTSSGHAASNGQTPAPPPVKTTAGAKFQNQIVIDYGFMGSILEGDYPTTLSHWAQGAASDKTAASAITGAFPEFTHTRQKLDSQVTFAKTPRALPDYQEGAELYIEAARYALAATKVPSGALETQMRLSYERIQYLGDRIVDQAGYVLAPYLPAASSSDVHIVKPAPVPNWLTQGYAAGPPLDSSKMANPTKAYTTTPATESTSAWQAVVKSADIPTAAAEVAAIDHGSATALRSMSDQFIQAVTTVDKAPEPSSQPSESPQIQLGLLVDAEATRAAEAADLAPAAEKAQFRSVAKALAVIGDQMWDSNLGPRSTGYPTSLLSVT